MKFFNQSLLLRALSLSCPTALVVRHPTMLAPIDCPAPVCHTVSTSFLSCQGELVCLASSYCWLHYPQTLDAVNTWKALKQIRFMHLRNGSSISATPWTSKAAVVAELLSHMTWFLCVPSIEQHKTTQTLVHSKTNMNANSSSSLPSQYHKLPF